MTRRLTIAIAAFSVIAAIAIAVALVVRSPQASRVSSIGTIAPSATTMPTTAIPAQRPSLTDAPATFPTATTVPIPPLPASIKIPRIGVDAPIVAVGLEPGTNNLHIPDIDHVGWYRLGPSPGQTGSAVLVGHVDGDGRPGIFWHLGQLAPGDRITIDYAGVSPREFRVSGRKQIPKNELPAELFSRAGPPRLALITCGGAFNSTTRHYEDNVVIVATPS
jgi:sortase (surface protein transpeptidase)